MLLSQVGNLGSDLMITTQNTRFFIFTYQLVEKLILLLGGKQ